MSTKPMGKLYTICEWIMKLAYINLLWIMFTVSGLILLGFMPATAALFTVVRKWFMKETEVPIWKTFFSVYKSEFIKSNSFGLVFVMAGIMLYVDYYLILNLDGIIRIVATSILLLISCLYLITVLFFFPVYVHYELKFFDYFKYSFFLGVLNIHILMLAILGLAADMFLLFYIPGLLPFFSGVSIAFILMSSSILIFQRVQKLKTNKVITE
ncbi:YesL family protein [Cytobacillus oceanisediminis]|uniref:YesL family protein n=2 Tax=Niallia TaxID=2837506 RepID=A0A941JJ87_NIACI|nr:MULTISPECIES: YesL family protein [Bacillaceae]MBQ6448172.1 YesL family protein [Bacillus sp. (in: firmicutes)]MDU1844268.1 YesL family protein [Niallia nealsonii]MBZ9533356.1 YesL family protein [Cytobacillus oceanisediminis]MCB5238135.1 YesL family protein [Niallia circulans]NMO78784.1 YesL family protein [Niallia alba]